MKKRILFLMLSLLLILAIAPTASVAALMIGDANGDGKHTAADARFTLRCSVELETPSEEQKKALDIIKDGKLTAADARMILRASVELEVLHECTYAENSAKSTPATCTTNGVRVFTCTDCGEDKAETEVIPATGHTWKNATCTTAKTCTVCGTTEGSANGHSYSKLVITAPTCTVGGYTTYACNSCNDTYVADRTSATGHNMQITSAEKAATCTETGKTAIYTCKNGCQKTEGGATIAKLGHKWSDTYKSNGNGKDATHYQTCTRANCTAKNTAVKHTWSSSKLTTAPGCETTGIKTYTCTANGCNATYTKSVDATGHNMQETKAEVAATCTETGTTAVKTCANGCGKTEGGNTINALGHSYTNYISNNDATCLENGTETAKCDRCDEKNTREDDESALGHEYKNYVSDGNATCLEDGTKTATCTGCTATDTVADVDSKLGHSFTNYSSNNDATCLENGTETAKCDRCTENHTREDDESALGHEFKDYVSDENATCTTDCTETAKCTKCDATDTKAIADSKLGHSFTNYSSNNDATCLDDGTETAKCDRCDVKDTREDDESALGHEFKNYVSDENATCTTDGTKTATCTRCTETDTVADVDSKLGHSFTKYTSNNDATCLENGTETAKCDRCTETHTREDDESALGHEFKNYVSDENATCTVDGTKTATCTRCTATDTVADVDSKLGHSFTKYTSNNDATCLENGTETAKCDRCTETHTREDDESALGHEFKNYVSDENATCTTDCTETAKCTKCDATDTKAVADSNLGHSFTNYSSNNDATCLGNGTETAKCDRCDEENTREDDESALGHEFKNYVSDENATCTTDGTKTATCTRCTATDTVADVDSKLGHSFTKYTSNNDATCLGNGTETAKCDRCDETHTREDDESALGHEFKNYVSDENATCTVDGTETSKCTRCDVTDTKTVAGSALGHSFTKYTSNNDATCLENGTETAKCDRCDEENTREDDESALGHNFETYVSNGDATCTEDGTKTAECTRCDATNTIDDEGSKLGHNFVNYVAKDAATCDKNATEIADCERADCDATDIREIDGTALGHSFTKQIETKKYLKEQGNCITPSVYYKACATCLISAKNIDENSIFEATSTNAHTFTAEIVSDEYMRSVANCQSAATYYKSCEICEISAEGLDESKIFTHGAPSDKHSVKTYYKQDASCTSDGWNPYRACAIEGCNYYETEKVVLPALGHDIKAHEAKAATCSEAGWEAYEACDRCEYTTKVEYFAEHDYDYAVLQITDCTINNFTVDICKDCGYTNDDSKKEVENSAIGSHTFESRTIPATCTNDEYTADFCTVCKTVDTETLTYGENKQTGHAANKIVETKSATCTEGAYTIYGCEHKFYVYDEELKQNVLTECAYTIKVYDESNPALGHEEQVTVKAAATCTKSGVANVTCSRCDYTETRDIPMSEHVIPKQNDAEHVISVQGSKDGDICKKIFNCEICGTYLYEESGAVAHREQRDTEATKENANNNPCIYDTYTYSKCRYCDYKWKTLTAPAEGHDFAATDIKPATCTEDGYCTYGAGSSCTKCGESYTKTTTIKISAKGHLPDPNGHVSCEEGIECKRPGCGGYAEAPLGHDYAISEELSAFGKTVDGFCCHRCGKIKTDAAALDTFNTTVNSIKESYFTKRNLSFTTFAKTSMNTTYTRFDFGIYTSLVKPMFEEEMAATEDEYSRIRTYTNIKNRLPLQYRNIISELTYSDIDSIKVDRLSNLSVSNVLSGFNNTFQVGNDSYDITNIKNTTIDSEVIKVTVNVKNEKWSALPDKQNINLVTSLEKIYDADIRAEAMEFYDEATGKFQKVEQEGGGDSGYEVTMTMYLKDILTDAEVIFYFDAETYDPILSVYNISLEMQQEIDMKLKFGVDINGEMDPTITTNSSTVFLFPKYFS